MTSAKITALAAGAAILLAAGIALREHQALASTRAEAAALKGAQTHLQKLVDDLEWRLAAAREREAKTAEANKALPVAKGVSAATDPLAAPANPVTHDMVEARHTKARELAQQGRHAEALTEFLWCFDTGMRQVEGYFIPRYAEVLSEIAALAKDYPTAAEALRQRRDAAKARLLASSTDLASGKDYGQINHVLGEDGTTDAFFDSLPEDDPRRGYFIESSIGRLMETQRYRELAKALPYEGMPKTWEEMMEIAHSPAPNDTVRTLRNRGFVNFGAMQIELRAGAGDVVSASDMIERVLVFDPSPETVALIKQRLVRAGHPELYTGP